MTDAAEGIAVGADLAGSYEACRRLLRRHDPTYYWAVRWLPAELRPAVHALYGFVRSADEIVDGPDRGDAAARRAALDALADELALGRAGAGADRSLRPVVRALCDAERRFGLPLDELDRYMASMRIDCAPVRIDSWSELVDYMQGSAGSVGRIMAPLLGAGDEARAFGELGLAFQLTNFLRDVREDWLLGRLYLPREDRDAHGVHESDLDRPVATPGLRALVAFELRRARELFESAGPAVAAAMPSVRPGMRLACAVYGRVLDQIVASGHDVLGARTAPPWWRVAPVAAGALVPVRRAA